MYPISSFMNDSEIVNYFNKYGFEHIYLSAYIVTNEEPQQLNYMLFNYNNTLAFPRLIVQQYNSNHLKSKGSLMCEAIFGEKYHEYKGCFQHEENLFVFFNLDFQEISKRKSNFFFKTTMREICDYQCKNNMQIESFVYRFFLDNPNFIYLYKERNNDISKIEKIEIL